MPTATIAQGYLSHCAENGKKSKNCQFHKKWPWSDKLLHQKASFVKLSTRKYGVLFMSGSSSTAACTHVLPSPGTACIMRNCSKAQVKSSPLIIWQIKPDMKIDDCFLSLRFQDQESFLSWERKLRIKLQVYSFKITVATGQKLEAGDAVIHITSKYVLITKKTENNECKSLFIKEMLPYNVTCLSRRNGKSYVIELTAESGRKHRVAFYSKHFDNIKNSIGLFQKRMINETQQATQEHLPPRESIPRSHEQGILPPDGRVACPLPHALEAGACGKACASSSGERNPSHLPPCLERSDTGSYSHNSVNSGRSRYSGIYVKHGMSKPCIYSYVNVDHEDKNPEQQSISENPSNEQLPWYAHVSKGYVKVRSLSEASDVAEKMPIYMSRYLNNNCDESAQINASKEGKAVHPKVPPPDVIAWAADYETLEEFKKIAACEEKGWEEEIYDDVTTIGDFEEDYYCNMPLSPAEADQHIYDDVYEDMSSDREGLRDRSPSPNPSIEEPFSGSDVTSQDQHIYDDVYADMSSDREDPCDTVPSPNPSIEEPPSGSDVTSQQVSASPSSLADEVIIEECSSSADDTTIYSPVSAGCSKYESEEMEFGDVSSSGDSRILQDDRHAVDVCGSEEEEDFAVASDWEFVQCQRDFKNMSVPFNFSEDTKQWNKKQNFVKDWNENETGKSNSIAKLDKGEKSHANTKVNEIKTSSEIKKSNKVEKPREVKKSHANKKVNKIKTANKIKKSNKFEKLNKVQESSGIQNKESISLLVSLFATQMDIGGSWTIGVIIIKRQDTETFQLLKSLEEESGRHKLAVPRSIDATSELIIQVQDCSSGFEILCPAPQVLSYSDLEQLGTMKWIVAEFHFMHVDEVKDIFKCNIVFGCPKHLQGLDSSVFKSQTIPVAKRLAMSRDSSASINLTKSRLDISSKNRLQIANLLDVPSVLGKNWKALAAEVGLDNMQIRSIESARHYCSCTEQVLQLLETQFVDKCNKDYLRKVFKDIGRLDILELIH
eukprot:gene9001-9963_t